MTRSIQEANWKAPQRNETVSPPLIIVGILIHKHTVRETVITTATPAPLYPTNHYSSCMYMQTNAADMHASPANSQPGFLKTLHLGITGLTLPEAKSARPRFKIGERVAGPKKTK